MKWLVEAIVDLVYPPEEGERLIPFRRKLLVFLLLVLIVAFVFLASR